MSNKKIITFLSFFNLIAITLIVVASDIFRRNLNSWQLLFEEGAKFQKMTASLFSLTVQTNMGPLTLINEAPIIAFITCAINVVFLLVLMKRRRKSVGSENTDDSMI